MLFSEAKGRKVVSTSTAETVGKVNGFLVDPAQSVIIAIELKKTDGGDTLHWPDVEAFGTDAVTVLDAGKITDASSEAAALAGKEHHLLDKRVLTTAGDERGKVDDVEFDKESGAITMLVLGDGELPGSALVGIGSYAVVVRS